jgi:hypothetical protein
MTRVLVVPILLIAAVTACEQKPKTEPSPTPAPTIQPARETTPARTEPQAAAAEPVPVSEDFEEQAAREITAENLESELAKLEGEVPE